MKKRVFVLLLIFVTAVLGACLPKTDVSFVPEESFYSDYYMENEKVYINCTLTVNSAKDQTVCFVGNFEDDVEIGLLTEATLKTTSFDIKKGKQSIDVTFVGDFGGTDKKTNRKLPDITILAKQGR